MLILACLALSLAVIYWYLKSCYSLFERLGIPGPKPVPLFGNALAFKKKFPLDVLDAWTGQYGRVYGFYEGLQPSLVVSDPYLTQQILVRKYSYFQERPPCIPFEYTLDDHSLTRATGERCRHLLHVVTRVFNTSCLRATVPAVTSVSTKMLQKLESLGEELEQGFDISKITDRYTLDAFANAAFGYPCNSLHDDQELLFRYMETFNKTAASDNQLAGLARLFPSLTGFIQLFEKTLNKVHLLHLDRMRELIGHEKKSKQSKDYDSPNLLRRLIEGHFVDYDADNNEVKRHLTDDEVLAQASQLVGGGLGPTHSVLAFAIHLLATNQRVQNKLREEIASTCPIKMEELMYDDLTRLTYLDNVLDETGRLYPVAPGVARTCTRDCEIDGVQFVRGMKVRVMATSIYKDEKYYPSPTDFIPERFSKAGSGSRTSYSYLHFGHGPRVCPGYKFGLTQIKIALIQILRHYVITPSSKTEVPLQTALRPFLVPKNGVHIRLVKL